MGFLKILMTGKYYILECYFAKKYFENFVSSFNEFYFGWAHWKLFGENDISPTLYLV